MSVTDFIGSWKLVSVEFHRGEVVRYPYGKDPDGFIFYNVDGFMSVFVASKERTLFQSNDLGAGTSKEKIAAAESFVGYCGRYEVFDDRVVHNIMVSFFPNWVGDKQERFYRFEGDKLILSTAPMLFFGETQSVHVIWQKVNQ
jgi:hypothetical protein